MSLRLDVVGEAFEVTTDAAAGVSLGDPTLPLELDLPLTFSGAPPHQLLLVLLTLSHDHAAGTGAGEADFKSVV